MEASEPETLGTLGLEALRRAVAIYLGIAYPDGPPPEAVGRRLIWPEGTVSALLAARPFERIRPSADGEGPVFALRLGNAVYPHMKLLVQSWPSPDGFLLSVNTHDQALAPVNSPEEAAAFRTLQAENQRCKLAIEAAWDDDGLPTFSRYLRNYLDEQPATTSSG